MSEQSDKYDEIALLSATQMRELIALRKLSPVEIIEACLSRIERYNKTINAICTLSDRALEDAKKAEQAISHKRDLGLLHGLPVGIKDVTPTAGMRTTFGSSLYADHIPTQDALVVSRFKDAGAIILGKTNTPEFAAGASTFNAVFGRTRNPWNPNLSPGGSTGGGAAALASGMIAMAEGTDIGGSLRIPASFCGIAGLRPSPGLIPMYPSPLPWDTLYVTGTMARTTQDMALMLQAVAGTSAISPLCQPTLARDFVGAVEKGIARETKIAYCSDIAGIGVDNEIEQICRKTAFAMKQHGAVVEEIYLDLSFGRDVFLTLRGQWMVSQHFEHLHRVEEFNTNLAGNIKAGLAQTPRQIAAAEGGRRRIWEIFCDILHSFSYVLTPCTCVMPFPAEQNYPETVAGKKMKTYVDWIAPTFLLSLTSLPVASVPCGLTASRLPVGIQIIGQPRSEESVLALGHLIENTFPIDLPREIPQL